MEMVPITTILRNATKSVDFYDFSGKPEDWLGMMISKAEDESFGQLLQIIPEKGFTDPITILKDESGWTLGDGHHRLTAAIMLGLDEIPVVFDYKYYGSNWSYLDYDQDGPTRTMVINALEQTRQEILDSYIYS